MATASICLHAQGCSRTHFNKPPSFGRRGAIRNESQFVCKRLDKGVYTMRDISVQLSHYVGILAKCV